MSLALFLHLLAATIWVGGMFFALLVLRPSVVAVPEPARLLLWEAVLTRFFRWVGACVIVLLLTGFWMVYVRYGRPGDSPLHVHTMIATGVLMMLLFGHVLFAPFRRLRAALGERQPERAAQQLGMIRWFVAANLALGILTLFLASAGRTGAFL